MKQTCILLIWLTMLAIVACGPSVDPIDYVSKSVVEIAYNETSVAIKNPAENTGITIEQDGAYITIRSSAENIEYRISGSSSNGALKIYSDLKFQLVFENINLTSQNGPAINIQSKKNVSVVLPKGTSNYLTDSHVYPNSIEEQARGTFFSEGQLIFSGTGNLTVNGHYKHGIACDDYILISEDVGTITVVCDSADGFHVKDYFQCNGGTINIICKSQGGDGIECTEGYILINDGTITLNSGDKGIITSLDTIETPALKAINPYLQINGGTISVTTGKISGIKSEKAHAIQSARNMIINGGNITVSANGKKADALHCEDTDTIFINGGTFRLEYTRDKYRGRLVDPKNILNN